ncbi:hypothetical protein NE237_017240 [Protea cynaroides]|uniref:O-methyltransferase C-terminal domain-containing protein n=1 Tax=Protea cynaroides TaxID=273540 RepID=A0A9Q0K7P1_9MAGN|nr:hypothetical protein NE237_017240 [Protea cynaroides]
MQVLPEGCGAGGIFPFKKAHRMTSFNYHCTDPRFNKAFNSRMSNHSTLFMNKILNTYKGFEGLTSLVDVSGGVGATFHMIVSKYPSLRGINFNLPHFIVDAPSYPDVHHVRDDMFISIPKANTVFMKWIFHDWSNDHCLNSSATAMTLSLKTARSLSSSGSFRPLQRPQHKMSSMSTLHLGSQRWGKERTQKQFEALAKGASFPSFRVSCGAYNIWVLEFLKKP